MVGVAVKITAVPAQTGLEDAVIATLTGKAGFTVMVMVLEEAGLPETHAAFEVMVHATVLPFEGMNV
mgnify:CR=1 FL=1